jgi:hypothetical protein
LLALICLAALLALHASGVSAEINRPFILLLVQQPLTDTTPPEIPVGLAVVGVSQSAVTLTWEAASDDTAVTGYRLYERVQLNPHFAHWLLRLDHLVSTTATLYGLAPGSQHEYAVTAFDAAGNESPKSLAVKLKTLQPPVAYHLGPPGAAIVGELFTYNVDALGEPSPTFGLLAGPAGMTVDGFSGLVQWTPGATDQGVVTATVRAANSQGDDDHTFSFPVYPAGTDLEPPGPTPNLVASAITNQGATLGWSPATDNVGVVGYRILAQRDGHGQSLFMAGNSLGSALSFTVTTLQPGVGYRLWAAAYDAAGNVASISGVTPLHLVTLGETNTPTATPTPTATMTVTEPTATATTTLTPVPTAPPPVGHVQLSVHPPVPSATDLISLTVSGVYTSSCTPVYQAHQVIGHHVVITSTLLDQSFCLPAEFTWGYTVQVGPLAAGLYTAVHTLGVVSDSLQFTVVNVIPPNEYEPPRIVVQPITPTIQEVIFITFIGTHTNACVPAYQSHEINDRTITVWSTTPTIGVACAQVILPWRFTIEVGPLPAGVYTIHAPFLVQALIFTFDVVDPSAPTATPMPTATPAPPSIQVDDPSGVVEAVAGEPFHYALAASGTPSPSFALLAGPPGMTIDPASGLITWTPDAAEHGRFTVAVRASNVVGSDDYTFQVIVQTAEAQETQVFLPLVARER